MNVNSNLKKKKVKQKIFFDLPISFSPECYCTSQEAKKIGYTRNYISE